MENDAEKIREILGTTPSLSTLVLLLNLSIKSAKNHGILEALYIRIVQALWSDESMGNDFAIRRESKDKK